MKSDIGFIAIGQGGGNIGVLLAQKGYNVLCINTSTEDLNTLSGAKHIYHIKGGAGCNKDRDKAKALIAEDSNSLISKITQTIQEEFVFVIFTAGGGTGSGSSPMIIDLLIQHMNKKVGAICVLPSLNEPLKTAINAYECFHELEAIDGLGTAFILDNKADRFTINQNFVDMFDSLVNIPEFSNVKGNIDTAEVKELLSTRGAAIISRMSKNTSNTSRLIKATSINPR